MPGSIPEMEKRLKRLERKPDLEIDLTDPDAPDSSQSEEWVRGRFFRPIKKPISIRVDLEVLDWFQKQEDKYQTLMNQALREYMENHRKRRTTLKESNP